MLGGKVPSEFKQHTYQNLALEGNTFTFTDLISPTELNVSGQYTYAPQQALGTFQTASHYENDILRLTPLDIGAEKYYWYRDGISIGSTASLSPFELLLTLTDAGVYYYEGVHTEFPDLQISSQPIRVDVKAIPQDYHSLMALFENTGGEDTWSSSRQGWQKKNYDLDTWTGVTLNEDGRVTELNLPEMGLIDNLPDEIGLLDKLEILNLAQNQLTGSLPQKINQLGQLREINLNYNQIQIIPNTFQLLVNLEALRLNGNPLESLPSSAFSQMRSLKQLTLKETRLRSVPNTIRDLESVEYLDVSHNQLGHGAMEFLEKQLKEARNSITWVTSSATHYSTLGVTVDCGDNQIPLKDKDEDEDKALIIEATFGTFVLVLPEGFSEKANYQVVERDFPNRILESEKLEGTPTAELILKNLTNEHQGKIYIVQEIVPDNIDGVPCGDNCPCPIKSEPFQLQLQAAPPSFHWNFDYHNSTNGQANGRTDDDDGSVECENATNAEGQEGSESSPLGKIGEFATYYGGKTLPGYLGQGRALNGCTDYIHIPASSELSATLTPQDEFSGELWIRSDMDFTAGYPLTTQIILESPEQFTLMLTPNADQTQYLVSLVLENNQALPEDENRFISITSENEGITSNQWHHVGFSISPSTQSANVYLADEDREPSATLFEGDFELALLEEDDLEFYIGASHQQQFHASLLIDELKFYNNAIGDQLLQDDLPKMASKGCPSQDLSPFLLQNQDCGTPATAFMDFQTEQVDWISPQVASQTRLDGLSAFDIITVTQPNGREFNYQVGYRPHLDKMYWSNDNLIGAIKLPNGSCLHGCDWTSSPSTNILPAGHVGWVQFIVHHQPAHYVVGLAPTTQPPHTSPTERPQYAFAWVVQDGFLFAYHENQLLPYCGYGSVQHGDLLRLERTKTTIRYLKNGEVLHEIDITGNTGKVIPYAQDEFAAFLGMSYGIVKNMGLSFGFKPEEVTYSYSYKRQQQVLGATAMTYRSNHSRIHTQPINTYVQALEANIWQAHETYAFRTESVHHQVEDNSRTEVNLKADGTFTLDWFTWIYGGLEKRNSPRWLRTGQTTRYNSRGAVLETRDIYGIYGAALYDNTQRLPLAVGANTRYDEIGFEGFETPFMADESTGNLDFAPGILHFTRQYDLIDGFENIAYTSENLSNKSFDGATMTLRGSRIPDYGSPDYIAQILPLIRSKEIQNYVHFQQSASIRQVAYNPNTQQSEICLTPWIKKYNNVELWEGQLELSQKEVVSSYPPQRLQVVTQEAHTGKRSLHITGNLSFPQHRLNLLPQQEYVLSAWVKMTKNFQKPYQSDMVQLQIKEGENEIDVPAVGGIINKWQRIEVPFTMPEKDGQLTLFFSGDFYLDDIRVFPADGNMQAYVYDLENYRLQATLDANNYATFYYYNAKGALYLIKRETARGIQTAQESVQHSRHKHKKEPEPSEE